MASAQGATLQSNQDKLQQVVRRFQTEGVPHLINGQHTQSVNGATFDNITPIDNSMIGKVAAGDAADIERAAAAAKAAFAPWRKMPAKQRRDLLHKIADRIEARAEEIAVLESYDTGQVIRFMSAAATRGAENFRFYADRCDQATHGLALPTIGQMNYTVRQPIGPIGVITPWNTPFMLSTWKIAPALAAGCTVVHKPAEWSPMTAMLLAEIALEAGLPPGVLNVVNGVGENAGKALTEHPDIKAIGFVGETVTGSNIMRQGAATLKRVHFELGGKNPVIVFADADLERALDAAVFMIYSLNGERCTSSSRLLIERSIYDEFTSKLAARAKRIKVGHPLDPQAEVGPLIHPRHLAKVQGYMDLAQREGVTIAAGGAQPAELSSTGNFFAPTLFTNATCNMRIAQEEIFGPVLTAIPFDNDDEALAQANSVKYGLTAYIWTQDITRGLRFAHEVEAGMVWVNSENIRYLPTPFGGVKSSGIGRDGGDYSFDFYMETKNIAIALEAHKVPKLGV